MLNFNLEYRQGGPTGCIIFDHLPKQKQQQKMNQYEFFNTLFSYGNLRDILLFNIFSGFCCAISKKWLKALIKCMIAYFSLTISLK